MFGGVIAITNAITIASSGFRWGRCMRQASIRMIRLEAC
ncbi:hypothetical protein KNP414_07663 [Paenibacillus mucilaginosus KNP414]|uniref:Uncharacterized protein n=1 Tax=Paenibacillus mucilaginosus (strain KNP414) TaxID=1036673 RepID=F8FER4_PAEMK|nr:hypothetical protein KNP414_07663 [Paenibacillus mucilaginosus KNP414]